MKPLTISVQIKKCPAQFETVQLGIECSLDYNESAEEAYKNALQFLHGIYDKHYTEVQTSPAPVAAPVAQVVPSNEEQKVEKKKTTKSTPKVEQKTEQPKVEQKTEQQKVKYIAHPDNGLMQKIVDRINAGVTVDTVLKYYSFDEEIVEFLRKTEEIVKALKPLKKENENEKK